MNSEISARKHWFSWVWYLALFTIIYNLLEGIIAVYYGYSEDTLTLFGFGLDSFIEMISALGIAGMIRRIARSPDSDLSEFEMRALKITGWCFYGLAIILVISGGIRLYRPIYPDNSIPALIISGISIACMWVLIVSKNHFGTKLNSDAIKADARCNLVCVYMSLIVLVSALTNIFLDFPYIEGLGALGLAYFSYDEGKEAFEKARHHSYACTCD